MIINNGKSGDSIESSIILEGIKNETDGISAEYTYLEEKFGQKNNAWKLDRQTLLESEGKHFDLLEIVLVDANKKKIYFDITNFFGKV